MFRHRELSHFDPPAHLLRHLHRERALHQACDLASWEDELGADDASGGLKLRRFRQSCLAGRPPGLRARMPRGARASTRCC